MEAWSRSTPWRQGKFLTNETAAGLGLTDGDSDALVIVVTHDCDLTQPIESEPEIEIVIGRLFETHLLDGNLANAKNARKLHLAIEGANKPYIELVATHKRRIDKTSLIKQLPSTVTLSRDSKNILQRWLASRYRRSAFPDEFESRLRNNKLDKKIAEAAKKLGSDIAVIYFALEKEDIRENENYVLDVVILYSTDLDSDIAFNSAENLKNRFREIFESRLYDKSDDTWQEIELRYVDVYADHSLSYKDSQQLKAWRLEHISLGADPQQPIAEE